MITDAPFDSSQLQKQIDALNEECSSLRHLYDHAVHGLDVLSDVISRMSDDLIAQRKEIDILLKAGAHMTRHLHEHDERIAELDKNSTLPK